MSKKLINLARVTAMVITTAVSFPTAAESLSDLDTIISRHVEARGGVQAIKRIQSLIYSEGIYEEGDYKSDGDSIMMIMRPYYKLVGHPELDLTFMEGYDGSAWEWFAEPGIVVRTVGAASAAIRHGADVEGPFVDYKDKGNSAQLIGETMIGDRATYQVRLTAMDGTSADSFIDQETFLEIAQRRTAPIHAFGDAVSTETLVSDYRRINGVLFAHRYAESEIATGKILNTMQWRNIRVNEDIPKKWFSPPEFERTDIQAFIEHLYQQRSDLEAVMWTYHWFRRAHPDIDTSFAVNVAAYQSLKMNQTDTAIGLLKQNISDYPDSADARYGLGRAFNTAGRKEDAIEQFRAALTIDPDYQRAQSALDDLNKDQR